jgi:hypothetical protein
MQIIETESNRIGADRRNPGYAAVTLAADRQALLWPVALNLGTGTHDPQIFGGKIIALSALKADS